MSEDRLMTRFLSDLSSIGLPVDEVTVLFRPYSKTYYGRYYPTKNDSKVKPRVVLYPYESNGDFMDYNLIIKNGVHEFCHHLQYASGSFIRRKGVMHNPQFWGLYNHYIKYAKQLGVIKKRGD